MSYINGRKEVPDGTFDSFGKTIIRTAYNGSISGSFMRDRGTDDNESAGSTKMPQTDKIPWGKVPGCHETCTESEGVRKRK